MSTKTPRLHHRLKLVRRLLDAAEVMENRSSREPITAPELSRIFRQLAAAVAEDDTSEESQA